MHSTKPTKQSYAICKIMQGFPQAARYRYIGPEIPSLKDSTMVYFTGIIIVRPR